MKRHLAWLIMPVVMLSIGGFDASLAADMAVKAPAYKAPPPVAVYNWTGFYVGGNIGAIGSTGKSVHQCINGAGVLDGALCDIIPDSDLNSTGVLGGLQAGYNWQTANWLFGLEGDAQGSSLKNTRTVVGAFPLNPPPPGLTDAPGSIFTTSERLNWLATIRGRAGFVSGAALFYATGGAAFGGVQTTANLAGTLNAYPSSADTTRAGWTAGGGVEWGFAPQWSAKFEGLYYDLGKVTTLATSVPLITTFTEGARVSINGWIARVGVNYHFGGPVVARY